MKRAAAIALLTVAMPAAADPLRLRADALATTASPAGLLVLEADGAMRPGLSAEAVVWLAGDRTPGETISGDVLVIVVHARTQDERIAAQLGRFVSTLGAVRPVHVDGATVRVRLPRRFDIEAVAGVPVVLGLATARTWDWYAGGRIARRLGESGSVGLAYAQRRDDGELASEEIGADAGAVLAKDTDAGARIAYDLANPGLAEVGISASHRHHGVRTELYGGYRAVSHLLPATSLFSVIGDVPAERAGVVVTWRAAPRLDLIADVAARRADHEYGEELVGRARLRLDDRGTSALGGELHRTGGSSDAWTGARGTARIALPRELALSTELELVVPDTDRGKGTVWPWGLVAVSWHHGEWDAAVAIEASASPTYRQRVDGLFQLSRRWSVR